MVWPFEWVALDTTGRVTLRARAIAITSGRSLDTTFVEWVGLPVVPLDRGFLQTLADPRSDRRILVLFGKHGQVLRQTGFGVPFGILAALPERRLLLALRRTDLTEIVTYRWDWRNSVSLEGGRDKGHEVPIR